MNKRLNLVSILSAIGFGVSVYQTSSFFQLRAGMMMGKRFCEIGQTFDCTAVEMSRFAELFPGVPLSGFAMAGYALIFILSLVALSKADYPKLANWIKFLSFISVAFSAIYLLIMLIAIKKLCLFCFVVDGINVGILIAALGLPKTPESAWKPITKPFVISAAIAVLIALVATTSLNPAAKMKSEDLADWKASILSTPRKMIDVPQDTPSFGPADAPITIVKFSDYQCPTCKMSAGVIHSLAKRYPKDVRFVFLNFPLSSECNPKLTSPMHLAACESSRAAYCAHLQNNFDEAYTTLFEHQEELQPGKILEILKGTSINMMALQGCMNLPTTSERIKMEAEFGGKIGLEATPTFFIDGIKIEGGLPTNLWIDVIETLLAQKKAK